MFTYIPYSRSLFAALLLSSAVLLIATTSAYSEDLLKQKTGQKYLGWQTAKSKFTTCDKTVLDINGTVEKANNKCEKTPGPGPLTGLIKNVNPETYTVDLGTPDGKSLSLFYPDLSQPKERDRLKSLMETHNRVKVISPVDGRADSITLQ